MATDPPPSGITPGLPPGPAPLLPASTPPEAELPPVWPRSAQLAAALFLTLALVLTGRHVLLSHQAFSRPSLREEVDTRLDLNQAGEAELRQVPGVGEALARRIIEERERLEGFRTLEDLRRVPGIGPARLEQIGKFVQVGPYDGGGDAPPPRVVRGAAPSPVAGEMHPGEPPRPGKKRPPAAPVNVNEASAEELQRLPGIGPKLAGRIVEARRGRPFRNADELRRVKGIGPKTLAALRPHLTFGTPPD